MNRADFNNIIHDTSTVTRQTIGEIRELLDIFPYFQSAHMLLLKGLNNTSDIKFESQLKKSAIYVADREVLYHLINDNQTVAVNPETGKVLNSQKLDSADNQQTVIETGKNSTELITESEKNQNIPVENLNIDLPSHGMPRSLLITEVTDDDDSVNIVFLLDDGQEHIEDTVIFRDPAIFVEEQDDLLELDIQEGVSDLTGNDGDVNPVPEAVEKLSKKQVQSDLIDKFIIANPRIEPVREKSDQLIEDKSNNFSEEKGGFITETLAEYMLIRDTIPRQLIFMKN